MLRFAMRFLVACVALAFLGCGSVEFVRTDGVDKAPPLPRALKVQLAERLGDVPQPAVVLGTMRLPSSANSLSQIEAEQRFLAVAARFGCDAVVEVDAHSRHVERLEKKRVLKKGGKVAYESAKTREVLTQWTALCVRTAEANAREVAAIKAAGGRVSGSTARRHSGSTANPTPAPPAPATSAPQPPAKPEKTAQKPEATAKEPEAAAKKTAPAAVPVVRPDVKPLTEEEARAAAREQARKKAREAALKQQRASQKAANAAAQRRTDAAQRAEQKAEQARKAKEAAAAAAAQRQQQKEEAAARRAEAAKRKAEEAQRKREEAAQRKREQAEAKKKAAEERKRLAAEAAQRRKDEAAKKAEERKRLAEEKKRAAEEAKRKAEEAAKAAAEAERKRIEDEKARKIAAIIKAFDDAIAANDGPKLAELIDMHPEHARVPAAQAALSKAGVARALTWFDAKPAEMTRKGAEHRWQAINPSKAPVVVRFEVAGMAYHRLVRPGKRVTGKVVTAQASTTPGRVLDVIAVGRELAIDKSAGDEDVTLETIARVWQKLPGTAMTEIYLQRLAEFVAERTADKTVVRGSVRAGRRPGKDEYQPAKVSLRNGGKRDVTVLYDAGTGRLERLILKRGGKMSLTLLIPPGNTAKMEIKSVLPRLRSLGWLTGRWTLGSAQLVVLPAGKEQVAAFVVDAGPAGNGTPTIMPLTTVVNGNSAGCRGKVPSVFARSVFFDLPPCPEGGCDAVITIPLQAQDQYDEQGGRSLKVQMQTGPRDGKARFVSQY